ncbi:GvpL/GvpF family gas vesicle protein [Marinobacter gelidimuriae]|uniref:GvpL/GvpF family gas vesicle protein n=1 Tax=Marinobacter gelidimuriae TaxID=2739064 RepID=UPI00036AA8B7|nr:GvpL/GvpF family gas vesicle protein [Marinobacter gelidimuriae]
MNSIYLYCLAGPACVAMVKQLSQQEGAGIDEHFPLLTLERDGVVAVIGEIDAGEFNEQNLQSMEWVGPRAYRHAALVEKIMAVSSVLPVKFGTIFDSAESLTRLLTQHRERIAVFLEKLRDKSEWSVKAYLDDERARSSVSAENPAIQDRIAKMSSAPGARYLQQKQVDVMLDAALRVWVTDQTRNMGDVLSAHAVENAELRLLSSEASERPESMVFNGSFLLSDPALPAFRAALSALQEAGREDGLTLELKGPWPPYNFCPDLRVET